MAEKLSVFIAGAGGIGSAAGLILREMGHRPVDLVLADLREDTAREAADWITSLSTRGGAVGAVAMTEGGEPDERLEAALKGSHILLDCLPGSEAPRMARWARKHNLHYANLTEYVRETREVAEIAKDAPTGFLLQGGLAPGYINVLARGLMDNFTEKHGTERFERVSMKVGALAACVFPPSYYAFTWSPIGVATEYVKPSVVVRDHKMTTMPALTQRARVIIDGREYEEALTSGGAADLPEACEGKVRNLDYKTLRHPGHFGWVENLLDGIPDNADRPRRLLEAMQLHVPHLEDDEIIAYACVEGFDTRGILRREEKALHVLPSIIGGKRLRAIQSSTAGPLAEAALLLAEGRLKGPIYQSQIDPWPFLRGPVCGPIFRI